MSGLLGLDYALGGSGFAVGNPVETFRDGKSYLDTKFRFVAFNADWDITSELTLTSVTGFGVTTGLENNGSYTAGPAGGIASQVDISQDYFRKDFSQEIRLASNFKDSWFNFTTGAYYGSSMNRAYAGFVLRNLGSYSANTPSLGGQSYSGFGQVILTPIQNWELSAGARYSHESKKIRYLIARGNNPQIGPVNQLPQIPDAQRKISEDKVTPEVTLTYRPTDALSVFVAYKQGYKGPGFNASTIVPTYVGLPSTRLGPFTGEKSEGFEGGLKGRFLDEQLTFSAAVYQYKYTGLQVSFVDVNTFVTFVRPAANAKVYGAEFDFVYRPEGVRGLTVNGAANYNHANYTSYTNAPCFGGQNVALGCVASSQNLSGKSLTRAPRFVAQLGFDYTVPVSDNYLAGILMNANYSSSYYSIPERNPNSLQKAYATVDASVRYGAIDSKWEVSFLVRNLTNKLYAIGGTDDGGITPGTPGDVITPTNRPREFTLRLTVRPDAFMD